MRVIARGCNRSIEARDYARDRAVARRRLAGNDRLSAFRRIGATDKIQLPARAAILTSQKMFGIARAAEINLQRCIDRDDFFVLRDMTRIVDDIDRSAVHRGIIIEKIIQRPVSESEGEDTAAPISGLRLIGHRTALDQAGEGRAHQFGMDAQIPAVFQQGADRSGERADAHLQTGLVVNHGGDRRCDLGFFRRGIRSMDFGQSRIIFDDRIDFRDMQQRGPEYARHVGVNLDDQPFGAAGRSCGIVVAGAESEPAMLVHWRHGCDKKVERDLFREQTGGVAKGDRDKFDRTPLPRWQRLEQFPLDSAQKHAARTNAAQQVRPKHCLAGMIHRMKIPELEIFDRALFRHVCKRPEQGWRLCRCHAHRDMRS